MLWHCMCMPWVCVYYDLYGPSAFDKNMIFGTKQPSLLVHNLPVWSLYLSNQRTLTIGEVSLYGWPPVDWVEFDRTSKTVVHSA